MTTNFQTAAIAVAALATIAVAPAFAQAGLTRKEMKQEIKADKAKLQADQTAATAAGVGHGKGEPEGRRAEVMAAAKEMSRLMAAKRDEIKTLEAQAETQKDPVQRREIEKRIGRLHHQMAIMQTEQGDAMLYNIMPHPERVKAE
ncbi:MAG TPA: hypothetical protein V6D22_18665 [Candidatus Obscuribacterales bacterium]